MQYDFTTLTERRGTNSMKWKGPEKELPAWVADMDFRTAPAITEAVMEKVGKGIFGYSWIPESLLDTVSAWWSRRYGWTMKHEWMHFATGVMPAIHSIVKSLTAPGDGVVVMTPVYHCFFHAIEWNGRVVREAPLHFENGAYRFDPEALEAALKEPATTLLLLCNPHNPTGELWTREELAEIGRLAAKYGVPVVSDEIHCDLTDPGSVYTPFASVNEECAQNAIVTFKDLQHSGHQHVVCHRSERRFARPRLLGPRPRPGRLPERHRDRSDRSCLRQGRSLGRRGPGSARAQQGARRFLPA